MLTAKVISTSTDAVGRCCRQGRHSFSRLWFEVDGASCLHRVAGSLVLWILKR